MRGQTRSGAPRLRGVWGSRQTAPVSALRAGPAGVVRTSPYPRFPDGEGHVDDRSVPGRGDADAGRGARRHRHDSPPCSSAAATPTPRPRARSSRGRCPGTTRSRSATWARRSPGSVPRVAAGKRICVHGDYDADGICATALAVFLLRELGAEPALAPPLPLRGGLRTLRPDALAQLAAEGVELVLTVDCGITAVAEVEEAAQARARGDRQRPPPARGERSPPVRSSRRSRATTRSRGCAGRRSSGSSPRRCSAPATLSRAPPRRGRARHGRRRRAAARREPRARAARAAPARRRPRSPGLRALMRDRRGRPGGLRRGRGRLPARAPDQRRRPARPARGRAGAAPDRRRARCEARSPSSSRT